MFDRIMFWLSLGLGLANLLLAIMASSVFNLGAGLGCLAVAYWRRPDSWRGAR